MSYSFSATSVPADNVEAVTTQQFEAYKQNLAASDYSLDPAADEQAQTAIAAVKAIVESGHLGSGPFSVTVSGHANPEHKATKGWANDAITVSVSSQEVQPS